MKRNLLFMSVLASLLMAGCSQEEIVPNGENEGNGEANTSYMAVNLVSSDVTGTRAATGYRDGTTRENKVEKVRFYFFNGSGGVVNVKLLNGSYVNYYDWTPVSGDQSDGTNDDDDIESKLKVIIVINTAKGDEIPQRIAAVLNPPTIDGTFLLGNTSMNLSTLKDKVADFATTGDNGLTSEGKFVMFNSVGGEGKEFSTTLIESKNLCKKEDDAIKNPVTIYVERSVAKVKVLLDNTAIGIADGKLKLKDKNGKDLKIKTNNNDGNTEEEQVYLQIGGWSLTAETTNGRLIKKVNSKWDAWSDENWYTAYRSFWAINSNTAVNKYCKYSEIGTSVGDSDDNALYTNENAQRTDINSVALPAKKATKVILKGTLCKSDGTPLTIVRHLGVHFVDNENLTGLKKSILNQLSSGGHNYYFRKTDGSGKEQIGVEDLQIVIVSQEENEDSKNNCYVCAELTSTAASKEWYTSMDASAIPLEKGAEVINNILKGKDDTGKYYIDRALVWKTGMTYYYYPIKHLNNENAVVRNHIYETTVKKIAGLGTPVYDPDQVIYPEKPEENDHYIAAQINILSWRLVQNDYNLEW